MALTRVIAALPVRNIAAAVAFYASRLGFSAGYSDEGFARLERDAVELHLWAASDESWKQRQALEANPIRSGAESFIAGTASCRIALDQEIDALYETLASAGVLHPTDPGSPVDTDWGTREFAVLDQDGNLLTFYVEREA